MPHRSFGVQVWFERGQYLSFYGRLLSWAYVLIVYFMGKKSSPKFSLGLKEAVRGSWSLGFLVCLSQDRFHHLQPPPSGREVRYFI